jgi:putative nucleotidyltransferase with HDIG domain
LSETYEKYLKNLPVIPEVARKIMSMAEDKLDISFKELENIIIVDPGLTAKILKVANSALYARQREIKSLQMAITLLGFKNIKSLVMLVTASNAFSKHKNSVFYQTFWKHSVISAFLSKHIAMRINQSENAEEYFLAGLLHDIGQVALFHSDAAKYENLIKTVEEENKVLETEEEELYQINHKDLGGSILQKWFFPDQYVDVAKEHKSSNITSVHKQMISVISIADIISESLGFGHIAADAKELLSNLLLYTGLKEEDIKYYTDDYMNDLKKEPLFNECKALFNFP